MALNSDPAQARRTSRLLASCGLIITLIVLLVLHRDTLLSFYVLWTGSFEYGHGLLVAPISAFLLWQRRDQIAVCPIRPDMLGAGLTALLAGLWLMSSLLGVLIGEQIAFVLLLITIIYAVLGRDMARICAVPILFLFLAVPFWNYLIPILQATSAAMATRIVRAIGVPVFNEGLYLTIPGGRFLVAEVCSGLRYLLASLTLGTLFAVMNLESFRYRAILFLTGIGLGIVFNWIRVAIIVSAGHYQGMDSLLVHKHVWLGWVLFVVVSALLIVTGNFFQDSELRRASGPESASQVSNAAASPGLLSWVYSLLCISLLSGAAWLATPPARASLQPLEFDLSHIAMDEYHTGSGKQASDWSPDYRNPDAVDEKTFRSKDAAVDLYVAYYRRQRQGAEVVNDSNTLYDRNLWRRTSLRPRPDQVALNHEVAVEEFVIQRTGTQEQRLVWRLYWVSGRYATTGIEAKIKQVAGLLQGRTSAAGIVVSTRVTESTEHSREALKRFLRSGLEPVNTYLSSLK